MSRRQARTAAMQMVYENLMGGDGGEDTLQGLLSFPGDNEQDLAFLHSLLDGVIQKTDYLDAQIEKHLRNWTLDRISCVNHAVLLVSLYEMLILRNIDPDIIISEAVALSSRFDTEEGARFINGVLASVNRELAEEHESSGIGN